MELIFEKSREGVRGATIRPLEVKPHVIAEKYTRKDLDLPEVAEVDMARHYTELSKRAFGVDSGFYPLGSCTMKYNPKLHEEVAALPGFAHTHPYAPEESVKGNLEAMGILCDRLMNMAGFEVVNVKSNSELGVDLDDLRAKVGEDTAALMLTNPSTMGLFERNISEISKIVHDAGGLLYYDGANLNAVMGVVRPGDMGFDVVHLNLHKTFSTPHGGGGPGSGPVGCKKDLIPFLPNPTVAMVKGEYKFVYSDKSIGKVSTMYGNFGVMLKALAYIETLGAEGIKKSAEHAVLNANYMRVKLTDLYPTVVNRICMHEFVLDLKKLKAETGITPTDIAKGMIDDVPAYPRRNRRVSYDRAYRDRKQADSR